jgi:hypothetical protein
MTPPEILAKTTFDKAFPILPERFPTFDYLLKWRQQIRDLIILPVKNDEMRAYYHTLDREKLAQDVRKKMGNVRFMFACNEFPYLVPKNTQQFIVWVKEPAETREAIAGYIKMLVEDYHWSIDDLILFERPLGVTTKLVKGTFPAIRHVHLWVRDKQTGLQDS